MKIIGHRGARGLAPENTLASIEAGITAGADMIEIDVRVTRDNVPVLYHDRYLDGRAIGDYTLDELRERKADIATLEQAIIAVNRRKTIIIEIKRHQPVEPIVAIIRKFLNKAWRPKDIRVASFDFTALVRIRHELPRLILIVLDPWSGVRASYRARRLGTKYICMNRRFLWPGFIWAMQKRGFKLSVYTGNNPARANNWERQGVYAITTDFPGRFKKFTRATRATDSVD